MLPHRPRVLIGQQVLYFLPYGQWVGIRSRRAVGRDTLPTGVVR